MSDLTGGSRTHAQPNVPPTPELYWVQPWPTVGGVDYWRVYENRVLLLDHVPGTIDPDRADWPVYFVELPETWSPDAAYEMTAVNEAGESQWMEVINGEWTGNYVTAYSNGVVLPEASFWIVLPILLFALAILWRSKQ